MMLVFILLTSFEPGSHKPYGLTKVVIDAGHGGHDPGCIGKKAKEKDIALGIALKLGKNIEERFPDVKVIYTRKKDEFVELYERAEIANNAKADLFICIHCNSACTFDKKKKKETCNSEISGVESWVMGLNKSEANLEVSKRENEVVLLEKDYTRQYDGFDPNSPEANIIFSLYQNMFLDQSLRMASYVQSEMKAKGRPVRGVKQAGFLVLYKTSMPSILIETGFLSNPEEEKFLSSQKGQESMANSIFNAFRNYKNAVENLKGEQERFEEIDSPNIKKSEPEKVVVEEKKSPEVVILRDTSRAIIEKKEESKPVSSTVNSNDEIVVWSVQFYSSPKPIPDNSKIYQSFKDAKEYFENGTYKYSTGNLNDKNDAIQLQNKVREMGYKDAFVVAFYKNKKISFKEAIELSGKK